MANNATIGLAVAGGYLLGRTRKARMAIGLGMFVAGRKLSIGPQLGKLVADSPVLGELSGVVRSQLIDATTAAASAALTRRANSLADALHERTLRIGGTPDAGPEEDDAPKDASAEAREGADVAGDGDDDRPSEAQDPPRRKAAQTRGTTAGKTRAAGRSSARKAGGVRKAATGGTRKTGDRGGGDA